MVQEALYPARSTVEGAIGAIRRGRTTSVGSPAVDAAILSPEGARSVPVSPVAPVRRIQA
jgi:hypothetical protein